MCSLSAAFSYPVPNPVCICLKTYTRGASSCSFPWLEHAWKLRGCEEYPFVLYLAWSACQHSWFHHGLVRLRAVPEVCGIDLLGSAQDMCRDEATSFTNPSVAFRSTWWLWNTSLAYRRTWQLWFVLNYCPVCPHLWPPRTHKSKLNSQTNYTNAFTFAASWEVITGSRTTVKFQRNAHPKYRDIKWKTLDGPAFGSGVKNCRKVAATVTKTVEMLSGQVRKGRTSDCINAWTDSHLFCSLISTKPIEFGGWAISGVFK